MYMLRKVGEVAAHTNPYLVIATKNPLTMACLHAPASVKHEAPIAPSVLPEQTYPPSPHTQPLSLILNIGSLTCHLMR